MAKMQKIKGPDGKEYRSVSALCSEYGISYSTYCYRIKNLGMTSAQAVLTPVTRNAIRRRRTAEEKYIGTKKVMKNGMTAEITGYRNSHDLDVRFENGAVSRHKSLSCFLVGGIGCPGFNMSHMTQAEKYIGKRYPANNGGMMTIIAYRKASDLDVRFDTGEVSLGCQLSAVIRGEVKPGKDGNRNDLWKKRVGERNTAKNGLEMAIVKYVQNGNITVRFEDGYERKARYGEFKNGMVAHPGLKRKAVFHGYVICSEPKAIRGRVFYRVICPDKTHAFLTPQEMIRNTNKAAD